MCAARWLVTDSSPELGLLVTRAEWLRHEWGPDPGQGPWTDALGLNGNVNGDGGWADWQPWPSRATSLVKHQHCQVENRTHTRERLLLSGTAGTLGVSAVQGLCRTVCLSARGFFTDSIAPLIWNIVYNRASAWRCMSSCRTGSKYNSSSVFLPLIFRLQIAYSSDFWDNVLCGSLQSFSRVHTLS